MVKTNRLIFFILISLINCQPIIDFLNRYSPSILNPLKQALIDFIIKPICSIINDVENLVNSIRDWLIIAINKVAGYANWVWVNAQNLINAAYNSAKNFAQGILNALTYVYKTFWDFIKTYYALIAFLVISIYDRIVLILATLYGSVYLLFVMAWSFVHTLITTWIPFLTRLVVDWFNNIKNVALDWIGRIRNVVIDWWNGSIAFLQRAWGDLSKFIDSGLKFVYDFMAHPLEFLIDKLKKAPAFIIDGFGQVFYIFFNALLTMNVSKWFR